MTYRVRKYYCASHSEIIPNMIKMTALTRLFTRSTVIALVLSPVLGGCSMFGNKEPEYLASEEVAPLKIPEGLDKPRGLRPVLISVPSMRMPAGDELEPRPPRVVSTAGKKASYAYMAWSAEGVYLLVKAKPDVVSTQLAGVISQEDMEMLQQNDATGAHKFHYEQKVVDDRGFFSHMAFWQDNPLNFSGIFMPQLLPDGDNTRVYLRFGDGGQVDTLGAEHVLGVFMDDLN